MLTYPAIMTVDEDTGTHVIRVHDVPGCITTGKTREEAIENIQDALAGCLCVLEDVQQPIPSPSDPSRFKDYDCELLSIEVDLDEYRK